MDGEQELWLAAYLVPPAEHALYRVCASVLGWDCRTEQYVARPELPGISGELLKEWVGPASVYGPHGTIGGAMRIPARLKGQARDALAEIARGFPPIHLERGRFPAPGDYWYPGSNPSTILVAVFDDPLGALHGLQAEVVTRFNVLATGSHFTERIERADARPSSQLDRRLSPKVRFRVARYRDPGVFEDFHFHVSFATALPSVDAVDRLRRAIVDTSGLFSHKADTTWTADALCLFERRPDGQWRIAEAFPLAG